MLKRIKKFFKKSPVNNERGSVMSVALIVIVVLTYSLTSITNISVNLAGATDVKLASVNDENFAKGLINQAISEFELYVDSPAALDSFNNVEIGRIATAYGVTVTDETTNYPEFGTVGDHESRIYKFAYTLTDGDVIYKFGYVSNGGTATENLNPFDFSLSTNEKLVMNGGFYDEITLYGNEVYMASVAPYLVIGSSTQRVTPYSLDNGGTYPLLTPATISTIIYATASFTYCESTSSCFSTNSPDPFGLLEVNYIDVEGSTLTDQGEMAEETISDFFGGFSYEDYTVEYIKNEGPTASRTIGDSMTLANSATVVSNNADEISWTSGGNPKATWPTTPYADITNDTHFDFTDKFADSFTDSLFFDGNFEIIKNFSISADESMFINGDLTINLTEKNANDKLRLEGTFVVTGNLYFTGDNVDVEGTFFVYGETYMNFNPGRGIETSGNNEGLSLLSGDNIIIEEMFVSNSTVTVATNELISAFFYSEESIWIDAVNGKFHMEGALFARALGNTPSNQIFMDNNSGVAIEGIVINSYRGFINGSGNPSPATGDANNRFYIMVIPQANFQDKFRNIPTFDTLISNIDNWVFESSEFMIE